MADITLMLSLKRRVVLWSSLSQVFVCQSRAESIDAETGTEGQRGYVLQEPFSLKSCFLLTCCRIHPDRLDLDLCHVSYNRTKEHFTS